MVYDKLDNAALYENMHKGFKKAFDFLRDYKGMPSGKIAIDGDDVYASVNNEAAAKEINLAKFETHKKYIDIQYILQGEEKFGIQGVSSLKENTPYDEKKDIAFYDGSPEKASFINFKANDFIIVFPNDGHLPCCKANGLPLKRIIIKVRI